MIRSNHSSILDFIWTQSSFSEIMNLWELEKLLFKLHCHQLHFRLLSFEGFNHVMDFPPLLNYFFGWFHFAIFIGDFLDDFWIGFDLSRICWLMGLIGVFAWSKHFRRILVNMFWTLLFLIFGLSIILLRVHMVFISCFIVSFWRWQDEISWLNVFLDFGDFVFQILINVINEFGVGLDVLRFKFGYNRIGFTDYFNEIWNQCGGTFNGFAFLG